MSTISHRILCAADRFDQVGYEGRPTKLLLGKREYAELVNWIGCTKDDSQIEVVPPNLLKRGTYMGMAIYEMDDDQFLGVS